MGKREQIVEIALTQKGYEEGYNNNTKYGDWYGLPNEPWCAMFVSWCAYQVGIPENIIPKFAGCTTGFNQMTDMGITTNAHITPEKGDLIFFDWDNSGDYDHVGIVTGTENGLVYTIEGNHNDNVDTYQYPLNASYIAGYAQPKYEDAPQPPQPVEDPVVLDYQKSWNKTYGDTYGRIMEDGIFGKETEWSKTKVFLFKGMENNLIGWCQCRLRYHKGYDLGNSGINHDGVDDIFEETTQNVVTQFQRDNNLEIDGIIGYDTISILF